MLRVCTILAATSLASVLAQATGSASVTPAVTKVAPTPGANLFEFESLQLVEEDLDQLSDEERAYFEFADSRPGPQKSKRAPANCKVFPGDDAWPSDWYWNLFNLLTGGALIPSVPQATPCYEGPAYDADKCKELTSQWTNSFIQFVSSVVFISSF